MELIQVFLLALGLSMDAFAVSVSNGICYHKEKKKLVLSAVSFGVFQALMPLLGYLAGAAFSKYVEVVDHWIALALLGFLGGKMLWEAIHTLRHPEEETCPVSFTYKLIFTQSLATSIDALASGIAFATVDVNIVWAVTFIGVLTFLFSAFGVKLGNIFGEKFKNKAELAGGVILFLMGLKILLEHLGVLMF